VRLSVTDPDAIWRKATEGLPPDFKPSMLQDIEKGVRTEIDFISGAIVKFGKRHRVPTPVDETLVTAMKGVEGHRQ
jgi:2-dehydropantoate 2-reductase